MGAHGSLVGFGISLITPALFGGIKIEKPEQKPESWWYTWIVKPMLTPDPADFLNPIAMAGKPLKPVAGIIKGGIAKLIGEAATDAAAKGLARTMDCYDWAKLFNRVRSPGEIQHLKPKGGFPATGVLPGDAAAFGAYKYHSFVLRDAKLYDEFHPDGIDFELWKKQFMQLNKLTEGEFSRYFDINNIPHPSVPK